MMQERKCQVFIVFLFVCLLLLNACDGREPVSGPETAPTTIQPTAEPPNMPQGGFFCSAVNAQGDTVRAFFREADGIWYLAVPSFWNLAELEIHYSGEVAEAEKGELNQAAASISGAFAKRGDQTVLKLRDGTPVTVTVLQSDLPSVQITLNNVTLDEVHKDKDIKHKGNTVLITGSDGSVDVKSENNVELKGRGNSTWRGYEKKGYQIKFSEKTAVLGMSNASKWVLLSNASDDSMLRSRVAYDAAKQLNMPFVPEFEYVDMWIDGEYRGTYMIGEKVELNKSRLDLKDPLGTLFERDDAFYEEEDYWIRNNYLDAYFVLKDSVSKKDQLLQWSLEDFSGAVDGLMSYLYSTPSGEITLEALSERIDVDSFALYYLVNEYVQNRESLSTSFYWYTDGSDDVLHLGPIWDFDTCMGNDGAKNTEYYCHNSLVFRYLLAVPQFYQRTQELYQQYKSVFDSMADNAQILGGQIKESAEINYLRWDVLGSESTKLNGTDFADSHSEALTTLTNWLSGRAKEFTIPRTNTVASIVSKDYGTLHFRYSDGKDYDAVRFVLWNQSVADSPVMWYDAVRSDGEWTADASLVFFQEKGLYQIVVYAAGIEEPIATGVNYVAGVKKNPHAMEVVLSDDMNEVTITVEDPERRCSSVSFVIWSTANNQEDLQVFGAEKDSSGQWRRTVDLSGFEAEGEYSIHVFGWTSAGDERLNATTFIRYRIWEEGENPYLIDIQFSEDGSKATITLTEPTDDCSLVNFLVWSSAGGQSDLQVFGAEETEAGQWSYTMDLTQFDAEGEFNVHAFGEKPFGYIKLNAAVFYVNISHE